MLFEQHLRIGIVSHAALVVITTGMVPFIRGATLVLSAVAIALPITLVGSVIPDLDEPNSHVYRWFCPLAAVCTGSYVFISLYSARGYMIQLAEIYVPTTIPRYFAGIATVTIAGVACLLSYSLTTRLLNNLTHRGLLHQFPTGITVTVVLYIEFVALLSAINISRPLTVSAIFALAFLTGFISHLGADGLLLRRRTYIGKYIDDRY